MAELYNEFGLANNYYSGWSPQDSYGNIVGGISPATGVPSTTDFRVSGQVPAISTDFKLSDSAINSAMGWDKNIAPGVDPKDGTGMLFGMDNAQWDSAMKAGQIGVGVGQLGLGLASYFQNKDMAKQQKELLGQQIESNREEIDAKKAYRSALADFGTGK